MMFQSYAFIEQLKCPLSSDLWGISIKNQKINWCHKKQICLKYFWRNEKRVAMSTVLASQPIVFDEFFSHPSASTMLIDEARERLAHTKKFTFLLLKAESSSGIYLCFYDHLREFHIHHIDLVENIHGKAIGKPSHRDRVDKVWMNGSKTTFYHLKDLIPFSMGVLPGVEIPYPSGELQDMVCSEGVPFERGI